MDVYQQRAQAGASAAREQGCGERPPLALDGAGAGTCRQLCVRAESSRNQTAGTRKKMQLRLPGYIKQFTHVSLSKQFCGDLHVLLTCFRYRHIPWTQPVWRRADFPLVALYNFWGRYQLILTKGFILTALLDLLFCTGSFFSCCIRVQEINPVLWVAMWSRSLARWAQREQLVCPLDYDTMWKTVPGCSWLGCGSRQGYWLVRDLSWGWIKGYSGLEADCDGLL